jgi:hypothetical protein
VRSRIVIAAAVVAGAGLPGAYLALGGAQYKPPAVSDPCVTREWRGPDGLEQVAEQIVLSALDGAACELGVSREALVLAVANEQTRDDFARERGIDPGRIEDVVRRGLVRSVDDAETAGALAGWQAGILRAAAARLPVDQILDLVARISA